jgi:cysteine desulfurase/selenocysteine lyase
MALKPQAVIDSMTEYYAQFPSTGGHGRGNHWFASETIEKTERAREKVAEFIHAQEPSEIIWTKNTTEGMNLLTHSLPLHKGDMVVTTDKEHNSNLVPWIQLKKAKGIDHMIIPSRRDNSFDLDYFSEHMNERVKIVSMYHTSNLDGYTIPAREIIRIAHDYGALVILDAAQSTPHRSIDVQKLDVDFLCFSVHKMCGPTGMGVLYGKSEHLADLEKFIVGGDTVTNTFPDRVEWADIPYMYEGGLQNYAGQIGAGAAVEYLQGIGMDAISNHDTQLNEVLTEKMQQYPQVSIVGPPAPEQRSGILSFRIEEDGKLKVPPERISQYLDKKANIMTRSGCLCVHSWFNRRKMDIGVTRISLYLYNTEEEIRIFSSTFDAFMDDFNRSK